MLPRPPHVSGEHRPDSVDRVVPIEALRLKARHGGNDTGQIHGDLVLDRGVNGGVDPGVWQGGGVVILLDERDPPCLFERQP